MPGVLKRSEHDHRDSECSRVAAGSRSGNMAGDAPKKPREEAYGNGITPMNGSSETHESYANGLLVGSTDSSASMTLGNQELAGQLPPEIEHITFGYLPLSTLIARLVQETFNGLNEVINELSDLQVSQSNQNAPTTHIDSHTNGNGVVHNSQANIQKKLRLLNFAQDRRAQFIKILVLSQWSRQAGAISKVIDLKIWLDGQNRIYDDATMWMGELKRRMGPLRMPNPDLKTALEVLSLGKASWLPDLGYIPPKPLSPQEILKGLRDINTLLSIRLNLHEKIPPTFRDFSIASGRATFRVHDEFEVELSIADEDPSSQLYFVDFRFMFSPTPAEIPGGKVRDQIEGQTNDALKREGLSGCYEFLHDLVLTHKLSILRTQAFEMARGFWSQDLKVETVHRSLVVQYWLNKPGGKNWIEVGIRRRPEKKTSQLSASQHSPHIALRWLRGGKEMPSSQFSLELGNLSLQNILKQVIAAHTNFIFDKVANKLRLGLLYSNRILNLRHIPSVTEPLDVTLFVQFTTSKAIKMIQEPVTGRLALLPSSQLYSRVEAEMNSLSDPASEVPARLANLRSIVSQEEVERRAHLYGWEKVKSLNPGQETMRRLFPLDTLGFGFFRRKNWSRSWILAFTSSLTRDSWWIVELGERRAELETGSLARNPIARLGPSFTFAHTVPMPGLKSFITEPSYSTLAHVERIAVGMISQRIDCRELTAKRFPHRLTPSSIHSPQAPSAVLHMRLSHDRAPELTQSSSPISLPTTREIVTSAFQGLDPRTKNAINIISAGLHTPIANIKSLTSSIDSSIAFHPTSGAFAFRLLTSVGESTIPLLLHRLESIERLIKFLAIIKHHNLTCDAVSLTHLEFVYASAPLTLRATIYFPSDEPMRISLDKGNPHLRIQDYLNSLLRSTGGLDHVILALTNTLPLLRAFFAMETAHASDDLMILPRSADWYQIWYGRPSCNFDVRLRRRRDNLAWHIVRDGGLKNTNNETGELAQRMKAIERENGDGWRGMRGGMVASVPGVEDLMRKIDEVHRAVRQENDTVAIAPPRGKKRKAEDEIVVLD